MKTSPLVLSLGAALALTSCAQIATVSEVKPKRSGFPTTAGDPIATLGLQIDAAQSA